MNRYAVIENGVVINVVIWDGVSEWAGADQSVPCGEQVKIGDSYSEGQFIEIEYTDE